MNQTLRLFATLLPLLSASCTYLPEVSRSVALDNAKAAIQEEDWRAMLQSLDTVQSDPSPSPEVTAESIALRALAVERLGREEESLANYRLLLDRYPDSEAAKRVPEIVRVEIDWEGPLVSADGTERETRIPTADVPVLRQPRAARDAGLHGEIEVRYRIGSNGRPERIEVVGAPHPMLASLGIEAAARTKHVVGGGASEGAITSARYRFPIVDVPTRLGHAYQAFAFSDCELAGRHLERCDDCVGYWKPYRDLLLAHCSELAGRQDEGRGAYVQIARFHPRTYPGDSAQIRLAKLNAPGRDPVTRSTGAAPHVVHREPPSYPSALRGSNVEGWVLVRFDVTDQGKVDAIRVVDSDPPFLFESAAIDTVKHWRYARQAASQVEVRLDFAIP